MIIYSLNPNQNIQAQVDRCYINRSAECLTKIRYLNTLNYNINSQKRDTLKNWGNTPISKSLICQWINQ